MSVRVMTHVWDTEFPSLPAKILLLKLADCANDEGENIFPKFETVKRATSLGRSTIYKWLGVMERVRILQILKEEDDTVVRIRCTINMDVLRKLSSGALVINENEEDWYLSPREGLASIHAVDPGESTAWTDQSTGWNDQSTAWTPYKEERHSNVTERPSPPTPQGAGEGVLKFDWIEELRTEGVTPSVLDHFLVPLLSAGLKPWKDVPDPKGPARQLATDFKRRSAEVLAAAANRLLDTEKYRLPPIAKCREAVEAEGRIAASKHFAERKAESEPELKRFAAGTPEYDAELKRWEREDPAVARQIRQHGFVKIRIAKEAA